MNVNLYNSGTMWASSPTKKLGVYCRGGCPHPPVNQNPTPSVAPKLNMSVGTGGLAAARSPRGSNSPPDCYSLPLDPFTTHIVPRTQNPQAISPVATKLNMSVGTGVHDCPKPKTRITPTRRNHTHHLTTPHLPTPHRSPSLWCEVYIILFTIIRPGFTKKRTAVDVCPYKQIHKPTLFRRNQSFSMGCTPHRTLLLPYSLLLLPLS